ncbi:MAG: carboxypeptidase-like regulatory domain-containing protein, partial [Bacteroidota bacterium]
MKSNLLKTLMFASKQAFYIFLLQVISMQLLLANSSSGQKLEEINISIHVQNVELKEVFNVIKKQTSLAFIYKTNTIDESQLFSFDYNSISVAKLLNQVAKGGGYRFHRINDNISVYKNKSTVETGLKSGGGNNTSGKITGKVVDENDEPLPGATVEVRNEASGARYGTVTNVNGVFEIPYVQIGDDYFISVRYTGFQEVNVSDVLVSLGKTTTLEIRLSEAELALEEVAIIAPSTFSASSVNVNSESLQNTPQVDRSINDFTRLHPLANTSDLAGFSGLRLLTSSITVDGSSLNNSFGLGGSDALLAGNAAGSEPISLDALEEIQVNLTP